jgi:hypothetical protein
MTTTVVNVFFFNTQERSELVAHFAGIGGFNDFARWIQANIDDTDWSIALTDAQVGKLVRYLGYNRGNGGAQGRLRRAFSRSFAERFRWQTP